ncbi:hypothetical protein PV682_41195 [Streptomyces niveiscabiei]|uniref:hypothetical protein n=1 Tax=Streptomyces niveiscabiei TaxID=164115 RepID=UPI0029AD7094|nr:hypothetical protein [Streptomyces niveiscabiei]MDX3387815.1 hypothetical protein [Streptomyces niveiscabiei]
MTTTTAQPPSPSYAERPGVLAARMPGAPYLALGLAVPAGFAVDPHDGAGTAHVTEHLAARRAQYAVRGAPGISAFTRCHSTVFQTEALVPQAADAFRALAALLPHGTTDAWYDADALAQERRAVRHELEVSAVQPTWHIGAAVAAALAPGTGLAAEHDATAATIDRVGRTHVDGLLGTAYRPGLVTLTVVGDLPEEELAERAAAALAGPPEPARAPEPTPPGADRPRRGHGAPPEAYGVSFLLPGPAEAPVDPWASHVLEALVSPRAPLAAAVRGSSGSAPIAQSVLKCRNGWLASMVWAGGPDDTGALAGAVDRQRRGDGTWAVESAARGYAQARASFLVPTQVRDALIAQAEGTGPRVQEVTGTPYDRERASTLVHAVLGGAKAWRLRGGVAEVIDG